MYLLPGGAWKLIKTVVLWLFLTSCGEISFFCGFVLFTTVYVLCTRYTNYILLTASKQNPTIIIPTIDAFHLPILCPIGPKRFVPRRYDTLAGRNAIPVSHASARIVSRIQIGNEGSNMAMPILANMIAPAATRIYGSLISTKNPVGNSWAGEMWGLSTASWRTIEKRGHFCRIWPKHQ